MLFYLMNLLQLLDPEMIGEVLSIMKDVAKEGLTMLVVTHEMGFARNVANRIFFMDKGKIAVDASPKEVFENPSNERLRIFKQGFKSLIHKPLRLMNFNPNIQRF